MPEQDGTDNSKMNVLSFIDRYGSYAFGICSLLLIWFSIVAPEMEKNRISFEEQRKVLEQLRSIMDDQRHVAQLLHDAIKDVERIQSKIHTPAKTDSTAIGNASPTGS
jgi:hypothetical protein